MYQIRKRFDFSASHQLEGLPEGHKCARPHGHNYIVEVVLEAKSLNDVGFVLDYGDLKPFKDYIDTYIDHRNLNELFDFQPSAENLAKHLYSWCRAEWGNLVKEARVSETPKTWASYYE
jgi:6-pyruvoyltetrahydropterin/6-carboxytetrahydropterin synthase